MSQPQAPAGFGVGFGSAAPAAGAASTPAPAAAPAPAPEKPQTGNTASFAAASAPPSAPAGAPTDSATAAPTKGPHSAQKPKEKPPAQPVDLMTKLRMAVMDGSVSADLRQNLKERFTAPFQPPPQAIASGPTAPASGTTGFGGSSLPQGVASQGMPNAAGGGLHQFSQLNTVQEKRQTGSNAENVRTATEFLNLLLMCDSGFNNVEVPTDGAADAEGVTGLHAAVGAFAGNAAANIITYLSRELLPSASTAAATAVGGGMHPQAGSSSAGGEGIIARIALYTVDVNASPPTQELHRAMDGGNASGIASSSSMGGGGRLIASSLAQSNPILLSAQCLYLLTRHFQMQASLLKSLLELLHQLLRHVRLDLQGRAVEFSRFRSSSETSALCTLLWFVVFSVVNVMAVWKKVRSAEGRLELNALLRTAAADTLDSAITAMRREFEVQASDDGNGAEDNAATAHQFLPSSTTGATGGLLGRVSASRRQAARGGDRVAAGTEVGQLTADGKVIGGYGHSNRRWEAIVQAYLSILTLAEACFLRGKQDDASYEKACDKAVEAFLGDRETNPTSMCRGKAVKRMHQLMPLPATVFVPLEILYVAPYEVLSYLFDYMVQFLRRISELEVASFGRYLRQMSALEERFSASGGAAQSGLGGTSTQSAGFVGRHHYYGQAMRALLPEARNYAMDGVSPHNGIADQLIPFTSEMSHILETLAACLQHLPPEVLNPDLDADCAATFFILENFTKHLSQVLKLQRSSANLWEPFTLKTVARYLDVLAMIGRNPQYIERVVKLLSSTQAECPELEWGGLVNQALECTGLASARTGTGGETLRLATNSGSVYGGRTVPALAAVGTLPGAEEDSAQHQAYRQYLPSFARKCQQSYVASFFMLMRQMFLHPELRQIVCKYFTLDLGLAMLHAERHSQSTLGSTLSLLSALIGGAQDAQKVLEHLRVEHFLDPWTGVSTLNRMSAPPSSTVERYASRQTSDEDATQHFETRSLLGHCEYEATIGRYSITIGFLNLLIALWRHDTPGMESFEIYSTVTHFVAHKIFIGVSRRTFEKETERGTVTALAAAALRHALLMCFTSDSTVNTIPFQTVMATVKAPSDVLGELLGVVFRGSARTAELSVHESAAVRQCLRLLATAIQAPSRQARNDFCFDARALSSAVLPFRLFLLCGGRDSLLTHAVLRVLTLLPTATMTEASHSWYAHSRYFTAALANCADVLDPQQVSGSLLYAPPELIVLDYDWGPQGSLKSLSPVAVLEENRSALLDLVIQHAPVREPSTAAWLCGFYTAVTSPQTSAEFDDTSIMSALVAGAQCLSLADAFPLLAVKYTRALYELRANGLYGVSAVRALMAHFHCHRLFLELQSFHPDRCHPLLLSKYAYVLKMLSLELVYAHTTTPEQLDVDACGVPSVAVEVALSLLERSGNEAEELSVPVGLSVEADFAGDVYKTTAAGRRSSSGTLNAHGGLSSRGKTVDMADWLRQSFARLPSFPECRPPASAKDLYVMRAADGVVQFHIDNVFNAVQQENLRTQRVPLTLQEVRDKLQPFIEANYCFLLYASAVNFVEGWCELVNLSFCTVRGLSHSRLRVFVQHILSGASASMAMTRAAQEQVTFRLFTCLSTLLVQLKKQVAQRARLEHQRQSAIQSPYSRGSVNGEMSAPLALTGNGTASLAGTGRVAPLRNSAYGNTGVIDMSASGKQTLSVTVHGASRTLYSGHESSIGRRRQRDAAEQSTATVTANQGVFSTAAGTHYSLLNASGKAELVSQHRAQQQQRRERLERLGAWTLAETWAATGAENQCLVRPLVNAVVEWGTRVSSVRVDLYASLLCLSLIPGVTVEEMMMRRQQDALFQLLVSDIAGSTADHTRRGAALELLIQLLQVSPTLRAGFVSPTSAPATHVEMVPSLGHMAEHCAVSLLTLVDEGVQGFLTKGGDALGELLWLIRASFDFLSVLSQDSVSNVLGSSVLDLCLNLRSWTLSSQIVLGHTADSDLQQAGTAPLEANKEVLMRLLLGAVRWFNLLLSQATDSPRLLDALQQFVRVYRHLIEYALNAPLAQAHVRPLTTVAITLYAEITSMLQWLSASSLVEECRALVPALALTRLLASMANEQFLGGQWFTGEYAATSTSLVDTTRTSSRQFGAAGPASPLQQDLVLMTVRNIAHLLVRTELGPLHIINLQPELAQRRRTVGDGAAAGALMYRHLRAQPSEMESVVNSLHRLADLTMRIASAGGTGATTSTTLGSLLLALHALVCLCHSFVLPTAEGAADATVSLLTDDVPQYSPPAASTSARPLAGSGRAGKYPQSVPLAQILSTLRRVQRAVYSLYALNADYRTGVYSAQTPSGFAVSTDSLSNRLTANAGDRLSAIVSPRHEGAASHPSTPLSLSAPSRTAAESKAAKRAGARDAPGTPRVSLQSSRDADSKLFSNTTASPPPLAPPARKSIQFVGESDPAWRSTHALPQNEHSTAAAHDVPDGVTIGALMSRTDADTTTALSHISFPNNRTDAEGELVEDPDNFVYAGSADWDVILGLEHTSRQLKIGVANAIAATEEAALAAGLPLND